MYAKKKTVTMFGLDVEVYQLPNGEYTMSKTQVGQVIEKGDKSLRQFLDGTSPEASHYKGCDLRQVQIEGTQLCFHSVPFDMAVAYWTYHARQGNEIALTIMANCTVEKMNRIADAAFGIEKDEDDYNAEYILTEVGSGMNDNRPKLKRLFHLVRSHLINRVIVEHRDRLTRFNYAYLESFFSSHGVVIEVLEDTLPKSYEAELLEDIISLMASMSAKIYGKRSAENRKKRNHLSVVEGGECS